MANVCPYCNVSADLAGEPVDAAGRLLRCTRCGTKWLPRFVAPADQSRGRDGNRPLEKVRMTGRPRFERVIDHVEPGGSWEARTATPSEFREKKKMRPEVNRGFAGGRGALRAWSGIVAALVLSLLVATLAVNSSIVGAASGDGMSQFSGLEIRLVRGVVERARAGLAVVVEGEISNITDDVIAVPAVRVSLLSEGVESYSWFVEPTETWLAGRRAVFFRSVHPAPPSGIDEVAFRLTERSATVIGMR